jgi:hypothetical protein
MPVCRESAVGFGDARGCAWLPEYPGRVGDLSVNPLLCAENAVITTVFEHSYDDRMTRPGRLPGTAAARLPGTIAARLPGTIAARLPGTIAARLPGTIAARLPGTQPHLGAAENPLLTQRTRRATVGLNK